MNERSQKYKGKFTPQNSGKYIGDSTNIIYRSMWERRCMKYFDNNPGVIAWASEEISIPYYDTATKKVRRYFPDFLIKVKESTGKIKTYVVEVKPEKQTAPPKKKSRVTKSYIYECKTYAVNQAKWKAAQEYCADRRIEFKIITERELGIK